MVEVLLVDPPSISDFYAMRHKGTIGRTKADYVWPPYDLMLVAGVLRQHDITFKIFDANATRASWAEVEGAIKLYHPAFTIFATSTTTICSDLQVAKIAKKVDPNILTIAEGVHVTALPIETLRSCPELDVVIRGEPEIAARDLVMNEPKNVVGITYRDGGKIEPNPDRPTIPQLDFLPFATHDAINLSFYKTPVSRRYPMTVIMTTRGCGNTPSCIYCSSCFYAPYRERSIPNVCKELEWIRQLGIREVKFWDATFTWNMDRAYKLCEEIISSKIDLTWVCDTRADKLSEPLLRKMKNAGCHTVEIGVESGDQSILNNCGKKESIDQIVRSIKLAKRVGLNLVCYFILGLPGETRETITKTLNLANKLGPDLVSFNTATPHPGTEFYSFLEKKNWIVEKDWRHYDPSLPPVFEYPDLSRVEMYQMMIKCYRGFYLSPEYIIKKICATRSMTELKNSLRGGISLLKWIKEIRCS